MDLHLTEDADGELILCEPVVQGGVLLLVTLQSYNGPVFMLSQPVEPLLVLDGEFSDKLGYKPPHRVLLIPLIRFPFKFYLPKTQL